MNTIKNIQRNKIGNLLFKDFEFKMVYYFLLIFYVDLQLNKLNYASLHHIIF